ncbi:MAG TPA: type II toxin-antitoxin system VapC family toxin [Acidimicrobiales bacterium]|nr:type II toxin-antitoxin system VapC family toxin [Acidimicrobiales bacterium]
MVLFVDTSAMLRRYIQDPGRTLVVEAMADDDTWCASALCRSETLLALHRLAVTPSQHARLWGRLRDDWDAFAVVPVDDRCLAHAVEMGATYGLRTVDAIHLAAADRLPRPARYVTFDRRQIPAAAALGFEVVSPAGG